MAKLTPQSFRLRNGIEVLFRSYEPGDVDRAQSFARQIAAESTHTLKYDGMPQMPKEGLLTAWNEALAHPVNLSFGAFLDGRIVGNLRFFQRNPNHPWIRHIAAFGMAVSRDEWGYGIGTRMLQMMEAHAKASGIVRIEAEVRCENDRGVALYEKNGFKIEGRREKAAFIEGRFCDEFFIAKLLS